MKNGNFWKIFETSGKFWQFFDIQMAIFQRVRSDGSQWSDIMLVIFPLDLPRQTMCALIAGLLHYFFLCTFTWMFVEGVHIAFMLVQVFEQSRSRLPYYYLTGYGELYSLCRRDIKSQPFTFTMSHKYLHI